MAPFIGLEAREYMGELHPDIAAKQPGDRCYYYYRQFLRAWKIAPRWTTANNLYQQHLTKDYRTWENKAAADLAWQVFFNLHVMPYEIKKRKENGEVGA